MSLPDAICFGLALFFALLAQAALAGPAGPGILCGFAHAALASAFLVLGLL